MLIFLSDSPAWQELYKRSQTELRLVQEQLANTLGWSTDINIIIN